MKVELSPDWLRDYFSHSKLAAFGRCPTYAMLRYVQRLKLPSERALYPLLVGRAVHGGQETDAYAKLRGEALSVSQVLDAAVAEFEAEREKEELAPKDAPVDPFATEHKTQLEIFEKSGERARIQPMPGSIEAPYKVHLKLPGQEPAILEGYTDLVSVTDAGDRETVEIKSGARAKTEKEAEESHQLALEALGAEARYTKIVNFVAGKRQKPTTRVTKPVEATIERVEKALQWVANTVTAFRAALKSGVWPRCAPGVWWCSAKTCEYYGTCYPRTDKLTPVKVVKIEPVGSLPPADWRHSLAGKAEAARKEVE